MRAGKLATRRYKVRRGHTGWIGLAALCLLIAGIGYGLWQGWITLSLPVITPQKTAATPSPRDQAPQERAFTLPGQSWFALQLISSPPPRPWPTATAAGGRADTCCSRAATACWPPPMKPGPRPRRCRIN